MLKLQIDNQNMQITMNGADEEILEDLSEVTLRILDVLQENGGNPVAENLAVLILRFLEQQEQSE